MRQGPHRNHSVRPLTWCFFCRGGGIRTYELFVPKRIILVCQGGRAVVYLSLTVALLHGYFSVAHVLVVAAVPGDPADARLADVLRAVHFGADHHRAGGVR